MVSVTSFSLSFDLVIKHKSRISVLYKLGMAIVGGASFEAIRVSAKAVDEVVLLLRSLEFLYFCGPL